jgi:hypothetical protein
MYKNKFIPFIREEGRIDLVKGERIQDTIATLRDTLFIVYKKMVISVVVDPIEIYSGSGPNTTF